MNRINLIFFVSVSIFGCKWTAQTTEMTSNVEVPTTVSETDSVVVSNLINQSKDYYKNNIVLASSFDAYLKEAEEIALKFGFQEQLSEIYHIVGVRYRNRSEFGSAIEFENKAIAIAKELNNQPLLANYLNMFAVIYRRIDENSQAMDVHLQAMKIAEAIQDSFQIAVSLNGLGNVYLNLRRYYASMEYFKKSLDISYSRGNVLGQAINTNNIGEALLSMGQVDSALVYFYQSLDFNTQIASEIGQAICFNSLGNAYILKNDYNLALKYLRRALVLNEQARDRINVSVSYSLLGNTYIQIKDFKSAKENLIIGLRIAKEIGSKYQIEVCSRLLALACESQNDLLESIKYLKQAQQYKDSIINEANLRHVIAIGAMSEAAKNQTKIELLNNETSLQKKLILQQKKAIFYFGFLLIVLVGAGFLLFWQVRLKSRYNSILMQQRLLRSQMNPHFIFNALSAIQVYILENDMENSSRFLSDFAKLMRQVLRSSQYEYVSLEEEKDMLSYYFELQRLRFIHPFSYKLSLSSEIDEKNVLIPPMLTQPFVENAIEHGVKSIGTEGNVEVRFFLEKENLVIEIEDNGIGVAESNKRSNHGKKHESMATQITNERLEVIRRVTKKRTLFEIIDLQREMPGKNGVLVRIQIPIIYSKTRLKKLSN